MTEQQKAEITSRITIAKERIEVAKLMAENGFWRDAANRLYYSAFHIVSAYLYYKDFSVFTHKGAKKIFHRELILTGILTRDDSKLYERLFELRHNADYDVMFFDEVLIAQQIKPTEEFIKKIEQLIILES